MKNMHTPSMQRGRTIVLLWTLGCLLSMVGCGDQSEPDSPEVDDGLTNAEYASFEAGTFTMGSPEGTPFRNGDVSNNQLSWEHWKHASKGNLEVPE